MLFAVLDPRIYTKGFKINPYFGGRVTESQGDLVVVSSPENVAFPLSFKKPTYTANSYSELAFPVDLDKYYTIETRFNTGPEMASGDCRWILFSPNIHFYFFNNVNGGSNYIRFRRTTTNFLDSPPNLLQPNTDYTVTIRSSASKAEMLIDGVVVTTVSNPPTIGSISSLYAGYNGYYSGTHPVTSMYYLHIYNEWLSDSTLSNPLHLNVDILTKKLSEKLKLRYVSGSPKLLTKGRGAKTISGTVTQEGVPLSSTNPAVVLLIEQNPYKIYGATITKENGFFEFKYLPKSSMNYTLLTTPYSSKYRSEVIQNVSVNNN